MNSENFSFPFACFDTEDDSKEIGAAIRAGKKGKSFFDKRVTQIAAITSEGERYYNKGDVDAFVKYVLRKSDSGVKYWYALNIGYDLGNLFRKKLDCLDKTLIGSRTIKGQLGKTIFVDVFNHWQMGVKALGNVFDLQKLDTESMSTDKEYVFRDVEIIRQAMLYVWRFAESLGIDEVPPTIGSLGVKLWGHWGGTCPQDTAEISRDAIFGGRVELWKSGNANKTDPNTVAYCDINSLYPFAMTQAFPGVLEDTQGKIKEFGIVQATVRVPECEIAVLPYRDEEGKIYFPWGEFTGVWTVPELREAEANGAKILNVHNTYCTDEKIYPYKDYVERIYKIRKASENKVEKTFYKLLMNARYGRTGNNGKISRTVWQTEKNKFDGVPFGEKVLVDYNMSLGEEVNWSHAAYITSYGRLELLKYIKIIGAERMIYCDTDSVIFDCPGEIPFPTGDELGQMKIEYSCSVCRDDWHDTKEKPKCPGATKNPRWDICIPFAPKQYRVNNQYKAKGVPKALQKQFIEQGKAEYDLPFKFREAARWYDRDNIKALSVWHTVEKNNNAHYDKKKLKKNRFFPCEINDI